MNQPKEKSWNELFAFALPNPVKAKSSKCTCGNGNCRTAKRILCTCRCHSENHGAANREGMPKLDKLLELDGLDVFPAEPPTPEELAIW